MLAPDRIRELARGKYPAFLISVAKGESFFPLAVRFGKPAPSEDFHTLRDNIGRLAHGDHGYRIEWTEHNFRRHGRQRIPDRVWFENEAEFLEALGRMDEVAALRQNLALAREKLPELEIWLQQNPVLVCKHADDWPKLLEVCRYFLANAQPGLYAREIPIPVHTKFIEENASILDRLLTAILPEAAINSSADRFEERFGLKFNEALIRFRLLDPDLHSVLNCPFEDVSLRLAEFQKLPWHELKVVISENKMTFLTLPPLKGTIGIFGGGYAVQLLTKVSWLRNCELWYWSDIDAQGYTMLARLRDAFPRTESLLMDRQTLDDFRSLSGIGTATAEIPAHLLRPCEADAWHRVQESNLRLEQERIPLAYVVAALDGKLRRTTR